MHKYIRLRLNMTRAMPSRIGIDLLLVKRPVGCSSDLELKGGSAARATAVLHPTDEHPRITDVISVAPHHPVTKRKASQKFKDRRCPRLLLVSRREGASAMLDAVLTLSYQQLHEHSSLVRCVALTITLPSWLSEWPFIIQDKAPWLSV